MPDEVDLSASFPLSRFVGGMPSFNITFALRGADSDSNVNLFTLSQPNNLLECSTINHVCAHSKPHDLVQTSSPAIMFFYIRFCTIHILNRPL